MLPALMSSRTATSFRDDLRGMIKKYASLWNASSARIPILPETFSREVQRDNERETSRLVALMERELRLFPDSEPERAEWRDRQFSSLRRLGTSSFGFPDSHFDIIFSPEYFAATRDFARRARAFDKGMEAASLAQAMRNVWVMNTLQTLLGRAPSLSPSIFAYSMLYPFTDNHLDRPGRSQKSKKLACDRLGVRLSGWAIEPKDKHEAAVFRLVGLIEGEYPRAEFPEVYESLLAIHAGQVKSLQQQSECAPDDPDLLLISIEKGGSSVLADGWLVCARLSRDEADFCFGFGVMLQLLDDLQDLPDDCKAGHRTLFTRATSTEALDSLANRLWHFLHRVLESMECASDRSLDLRDLIRRNSTMLLLRALAENAGSYSPGYIDHMERFSPLGFDFLRSCRRSIEERYARVWPALARRRNLSSIFDLLG